MTVFFYTPKCSWVVTSKALLCRQFPEGTALGPQAGCGPARPGRLLCPRFQLSPGLAAGVWREGQVPPWGARGRRPHSGGPRRPVCGLSRARVRGVGGQPLPSARSEPARGRPASGLPRGAQRGPGRGRPPPCWPRLPCPRRARPPHPRNARARGPAPRAPAGDAWSALSPAARTALSPPAPASRSPASAPGPGRGGPREPTCGSATSPCARTPTCGRSWPRWPAAATSCCPRASRSGSRPSSRCGRGAAASTQPRRGRGGGLPVLGDGGFTSAREQRPCARRARVRPVEICWDSRSEERRPQLLSGSFSRKDRGAWKTPAQRVERAGEALAPAPQARRQPPRMVGARRPPL